MLHFHQGAADFGWAVRAASTYWPEQNPYDTPLEQYPLTAAFLECPSSGCARRWRLPLFYGISSALLAFGISRHGYHRLLVFLAYPYWGGLLAVQWSNDIFSPAHSSLSCCQVTMAKPQLGLPVALTQFKPSAGIVSLRGDRGCLR
jgi:hypothetical protein